MSVGLLLITHENIASSLLKTARLILDTSPLATRALEVPLDFPVEKVLTQAREYLKALDTGHGVLVISDIYGSTPSNIARQLCTENNYRLVAGLNLPMLIRVLNYPQLSLENMALKAVSGGHDGITLCECHNE
ncbi:PTS system, mannose/fructose/sorbose family, IIA component [hydrothermal vent metagenome]|uniref:PTS system, mannose/fructose/sorbose family, IIA component n=1 Tax=hydrothermal vent metagenome TaxID=652676 RepID=A0A3B0X8V7_9ZZZZ